MKKVLIISSLGALILAVVLFGGWGKSGSSLQYRLVSIEQGDVESVVEATGTLQATKTVQVGAQVSGQIDRITVDYNDRVEAGQVIARINPALLQTEVNRAEADLARCLAEQEHQEEECQRITSLSTESLVSDTDLNSAQYRLDLARAEVQAARVDLDRARQNLAFTEITAPVDGVVINRNVDVGQTVASNFSSPLLFLIAEDLTRMEILVSVDESDIGQIVEGQETGFTVQAYPDETYHGTVKQIRLQSTREENVVNYTVVVDVDNQSGELLPGMTASVEFLIDSARNVMLAPNAALRFRPSEEMIGALNKVGRGPESGTETESQTGNKPSHPDGMVPLFFLDETGQPDVMLIKTGLSDGSTTQIIGPDLKPGLQVIAGVTGSGKKTIRNPFQSGQDDNQGPSRRPQG